MVKKRRSGVLLPLSSVNGDFAVGVMGQEAESFIKKIKRMGFSLWQMLPVVQPDGSNSPYCSMSAFAGSIIYIDPRRLAEKGLVTFEQVRENLYTGSQYTANYGFAMKKRTELLRSAFKRLDTSEKEKIREFCEKYPFFEDYGLFMAIKEKFGFSPWYDWDGEYRVYEKALLHKSELSETADFYIYTQYEFYSQWFSLKAFANENGIELMGDMPIYVSLDSVDVWSNPELFKLSKDTLKPLKVAGVPPDYFAKKGQKWGNPVYDWDKMKKTNYMWWRQRVLFALSMYDTVRIDHFRAFASYYEVDPSAETAEYGEWIKGPGYELFETMSKDTDSLPIIAEDLGTFGEDVMELLEKTCFPGMRVIEFGFDPFGDSTHLPHNYERNCVAYTGTHDNNTLLGWLYEAGESERNFALGYCGFTGENWGEGGYKSQSCRAVIETVWKSPAFLSVVPFQDMCGFGCDARMNTPGTAENNWLYRAGNDAVASVDEEYFIKINNIFKRT